MLALSLNCNVCNGGQHASPAEHGVGEEQAYPRPPGRPVQAGYMDPSAPIQERVTDLLSKMTTEEKIAQLAAIYLMGDIGEEYSKTGLGWTVFPGSAQKRNDMQSKIMQSSRLHLPLAFTEESLHSSVEGGTVFPTPVLQGCTWNTSLVTMIASSIALEASSVGVDIGLTPVLNMFTDPRFGRHSEGFSENPTLSAAYAKAAVAGYQGDNGTGPLSYLDHSKHFVSLAKHYAAYGNAAGGQNAGPSHFDMQTLFDIYLKPWQAFAMHGGRGAMASHQTVNHLPCHGNPYLVNSILRETFGFGNGSITSDCNDISVLAQYRIAANATQAAAKGLQGGVDIDSMCGHDPSLHSYNRLGDALSDGLITVSDIDTAAGHILAGKFALRLFDEPLVNDTAPSVLNTPEHQMLAYEAALQGMTIAKYPTGQWPPIASTGDAYIAVLGPNGGCPDEESSFEIGELAGVNLEHGAEYAQSVSSPSRSSSAASHCDAQTNMAGPNSQYGDVDIKTVATYLKEKVNGSTGRVAYSRGCEIGNSSTADLEKALQLAANATHVVVVVGDSLMSYGEWHDRDSLDLPGGQLKLIEQVKNVTKAKIILVVTSGGPVTFGDKNAVLDMADYVLIAWRSGQMGGVAIGDAILGHAEPTGRLAQGWPRNVGQLLIR
eukprot:scpid50308/ scgid5819/ Periplasmic beta-glucosidase; Beta-D-glucoside glucohydrolase; Cellobiase; Gentiobiase